MQLPATGENNTTRGRGGPEKKKKLIDAKIDLIGTAVSDGISLWVHH